MGKKTSGEGKGGGAGSTVGEADAAASRLELLANEGADLGQSIIWLSVDGVVQGAFAMADQVRSESAPAVAGLKEAGLKVVMLTGDSEDAARGVARQTGIDEYRSMMKPVDKAHYIEELKAKGGMVAMVGDGINDAPALLAANVGIAIGAGTNVAIEAGDLVLMRNDPGDILKIVQLSKASYRKMLQNLVWATGYNVVAIPLAAGVLAKWGILLSPAVGAILMSASTVLVALNAQLLRKRTMTMNSPMYL